MTEEEFIKNVTAAPAVVLDATVDTSKQIFESVTHQKHIKQASDFWKMLGPGLTTGAADDDPSGITTYSQAGAGYGFQLLWLSLFTFPFMAIVQEMCARIGLVTGRGLAGAIRHNYPKSILYTCTVLIFFANTLNLGADLGAMAKASQLLLPQYSFVFFIIGFTVLSLLLQIYSTYEKYAKYLKLLALVLISYIFSSFVVHLDWEQAIWHTFVPAITFSKDQIFLITGILGTTISPYLFFWQTSQEVEEEILKGRTTVKLRQETETTDLEIKNMQTDVWSGMFLSNIVMFFIIAACAATLYMHGITTIKTAADAAAALRPLAGEQAFLLFALGIVGTGLLAVPILAGSASYALSESFRWKTGLYRKVKDAPSFYGIIIIATIIGLLMNLIGIDSIQALLYSAVVNGLVAPVILVLIILISSNKKIMGNRANSPAISLLGWIITGIMILSGVATIASLLLG